MIWLKAQDESSCLIFKITQTRSPKSAMDEIITAAELTSTDPSP